MTAIPLLVFSDLDGTLLDHEGYSFKAARPAINALKAMGGRLVLASSKTAPEIAELHAAMGLGDTPAITENGAAVMVPGQDDPASRYDELRAVLDDVPFALRASFEGFGDMTDARVAELTGLPPKGAALARTRAHSEPGVWSGSDEALQDFLAALARNNVTARKGGRFLTLSFGGTKADQMAKIITRFAPERTLALGDAPNDIEMIEAADQGVIIRNDHGPNLPPLAGETAGRITRTTQPGPEGWNTAVQAVIDKIQRDRSTR